MNGHIRFQRPAVAALFPVGQPFGLDDHLARSPLHVHSAVYDSASGHHGGPDPRTHVDVQQMSFFEGCRPIFPG
ncbi:hypothetical protein D3C81_1997710 [compost metagenome]